MDNILVRYTWLEESKNENCEYINAKYKCHKHMPLGSSYVSVANVINSHYIFDYISPITNIPDVVTYIALDKEFVNKYAFFKFSSKFYLDYCRDYLSDIIEDKLDKYNFSVYYDDEYECIYLMDRIIVEDVLVNKEEIVTVGKSETNIEADLNIGFKIEETRNKKEIIDIIVEALYTARQDDSIYSYLQGSTYAYLPYITYMPSSSYEVDFREKIVGTDLSEAINKQFNIWKKTYYNFEEIVRRSLNISPDIEVTSDMLYGSGLTIKIDPNSFTDEIDFDEVEDDILHRKISESVFEDHLNEDKLKELFEKYKSDLEDEGIRIFQAKNFNKEFYMYKNDTVYRIPAFILFHALSMQGFYCENEIYSFIDTLKDCDKFLIGYEYEDTIIDTLVEINKDPNEIIEENLYSALKNIATFIKYDGEDKSTIKLAIKTSLYEDLWKNRDWVEEIVTEHTKNLKDVTVDCYVSIYDNMIDIEANRLYAFDRYLYMDRKLAEADNMFLYIEIRLF